MFYPTIKQHISPSALAAWFDQRSMFVRSYFMGEKTPETPSMRAGKQIHKMIEAGLLTVEKRYEHNEKTLAFAAMPEGFNWIDVAEDGSYELPEGALFAVLGIPDSYEPDRDHVGTFAMFVDYKSGKENHWDDTKLAGDLKMKMTAWLVWMASDKPKEVQGFIEYVPTAWNPETKEVEITGEMTTVVATVVYTREELEQFEFVIRQTIAEINRGYDEWLTSTDAFVDQNDITEYAELERQIKDMEHRQETLAERIESQMEFGKKSTVSTVFGSFYFTVRNKFTYPKDLPVRVEDATLSLGSAEKVIAATAAAKKKFETEHDPSSTSRTLAFRAKK